MLLCKFLWEAAWIGVLVGTSGIAFCIPIRMRVFLLYCVGSFIACCILELLSVVFVEWFEVLPLGFWYVHWVLWTWAFGCVVYAVRSARSRSVANAITSFVLMVAVTGCNVGHSIYRWGFPDSKRYLGVNRAAELGVLSRELLDGEDTTSSRVRNVLASNKLDRVEVDLALRTVKYRYYNSKKWYEYCYSESGRFVPDVNIQYIWTNRVGSNWYVAVW